MPIVYDKLFALLKEKKISSYTVQKTGLLGRSTEQNMKAYRGGPDYKVLCRLCEALNAQPGDLMEYVPEGKMEEYLETKAEKEKNRA